MSVKLISSIALAGLAMATVAMSTPASAGGPACLPGFKTKQNTSTILKCSRAGIKAASFNTVVTQAWNANCQPLVGPWVHTKLLKHAGRGRVWYSCTVTRPPR